MHKNKVYGISSPDVNI